MRRLARQGWEFAGRVVAPPTDVRVWLTMAKAGVASAISWELARWWVGNGFPVFAPLAAMLTVQATVVESIRVGFQRTAGVVGGVLLAFLLASALGVHWWSIGLLVFLGLLVGNSFHLSTSGATQVAVSALLVLVLSGGSDRYAIDRVLDTLIGAAVGMIVSMAVFPAVHVRDSGHAVRHLADALAAVLVVDAEALRTGWPGRNWSRRLERARSLEDELARARTAVNRGDESVRYNPAGRATRSAIDQHRDALRRLTRASTMVLGITRTFADEADAVGRQETPDPPLTDDLRLQLVDVLLGAAEVLRQAGRAVVDDTESLGSAEVLAQLHAARVATGDDARTLIRAARVAQLPTRQWLLLGSVLTDVRRLVNEVEAPVAA